MVQSKLSITATTEVRFDCTCIQGNICTMHLATQSKMTVASAGQKHHLVGKAGAMISVLGILDDLLCEEPIHKGGWVAILPPASDWVLKVGSKECSLKIIHIPAWSCMQASNVVLGRVKPGKALPEGCGVTR